MAVNSAFHTNNLTSLKSERNLYSDLIKEAIQIHGHDVYYMDRQSVAADTIFGEDALNKFNTQHTIEMYVEDGEGYAGDKEIMTQFGLENRNEITFHIYLSVKFLFVLINIKIVYISIWTFRML